MALAAAIFAPSAHAQQYQQKRRLKDLFRLLWIQATMGEPVEDTGAAGMAYDYSGKQNGASLRATAGRSFPRKRLVLWVGEKTVEEFADRLLAIGFERDANRHGIERDDNFSSVVLTDRDRQAWQLSGGFSWFRPPPSRGNG